MDQQLLTLTSQRFTAGRGYLSAATSGLPTVETAAAMRRHIDSWEQGLFDPVEVAEQLERCREYYASIAGVAASRVGIGSQVSQLVSVIAASLSSGSEVLCVRGDFASLAHPFLQREGVTLRYAELADLASAVNERTSLVAFSLVQSATGEIADHHEITRAAEKVGARTLADLTQSLGWYDIGAHGFDYTVCHSYKWLCAPRGVAFLTVRAGQDDELNPIAAGWYSAEEVWGSCYTDHMPLADNASRFDLSPVWPSVGGAEAALSFFAGIDRAAVQRHDLDLARRARELLGIEPGASAIVTWPDPEGRDLAAMRTSGITAAGRAGNARISFHLWNTEEDLELLKGALGR